MNAVNIKNNEKLFYRVEHSDQTTSYLAKYAKNCVNTKLHGIYSGAWGVSDLIHDNNDLEYFCDISTDHALPYYKPGRPFDKEINDIVMGPNGPDDNLIKEHFIYGCSSKRKLDQYFPDMLKKILHNIDCIIGVYSSEYIYTSKYQSVMDISKPFKYIATVSLEH